MTGGLSTGRLWGITGTIGCSRVGTLTETRLRVPRFAIRTTAGRFCSPPSLGTGILTVVFTGGDLATGGVGGITGAVGRAGTTEGILGAPALRLPFPRTVPRGARSPSPFSGAQFLCTPATAASARAAAGVHTRTVVRGWAGTVHFSFSRAPISQITGIVETYTGKSFSSI